MLKIGLVGCGGIAQTHAVCYESLTDRMQLAAAADLDYDKAKKITDKLGGEVYGSADELLEKADVDVIDICLPTFLHTEYAIKAMEKGCSVFIEKPVCLTQEEAQCLLEAEKRTGAKVQIGQVIRFWNEYVWLRNTVLEGTYGKLLSASFSRLSPNPSWGWQNWFNKPELSGSMATDLHIHDVDFIRYLMGGEPDSLSSHATRNQDGVISHLFTTYRYGDVVITSEGCWDFPASFPFQGSYLAMLEKATVIYRDGKLMVYPADGEAFQQELASTVSDEEVSTGTNLTSHGGHYNELEYFLTRLESGLPLEIAPLSEAVKSLALVQEEIKQVGGVQVK